jgi:uncharacterized protein YaeQ
MALKSTVYKADLHISNLNTDYYQQHVLTLAKHPSETDERLMVRILGFALYAQEGLQLGKGVSAEQEPALWQKDLTGEIELWIDIGLPEAKRVRKASGLAKKVVVIIYGKRNIEQWLTENEETFKKRNNINVLLLETKKTQELAALASRTMLLNCIIEGGQISLISETATDTIEPKILYRSDQ